MCMHVSLFTLHVYGTTNYIYIFIIYNTVGTLSTLWRKSSVQGDVEKIVFSVPQQNMEESTFKVKYDKTQKQLESIAAMDDLLSGATYTCMYTKSGLCSVLFCLSCTVQMISVSTSIHVMYLGVSHTHRNAKQVYGTS